MSSKAKVDTSFELSLEVQEVPISAIKRGERYRKDLGDIEELKIAIKDKGLIQPITIDQHNNLIAGERRLEACAQLGHRTIPCVIRKSKNELDLREVELIENTCRKDLHFTERAKLTHRINELMSEKDPNWSMRKQSELEGTALGAIAQRIALAEALDIIPELGDCKTEGEALKRLKRLESEQIIHEMNKKSGAKVQGAARYAKDHYKIGDALSSLEKVNPGVFHFAEVDPPYGINLKQSKGKETTAQRYQEIDQKDYPRFLERAAQGVFRSLHENSFCIWWYGCEWYQILVEILQEAKFQVASVPAIWVKPAGQTSAPESSLASCYEPFLVARKGMPKLRKMGRRNVFDYTPLAPASKIHPTEKPLELMLEILEVFAYPGASVIVPFLGSGVTLRACYKQNMVGMGWDLDELTKNRFLVKVQADAVEEQAREG